ncbi:MAG: hypothetical protein JSS20_15230, partial [Proteobacteria bacterium]|nr:hypothetical protein [Pseudomonadota bacterium]
YAPGEKKAFLKSLEYHDLGAKGDDPIYGRGLVLAPKQCGSEPPAAVAVEAPADTTEGRWATTSATSSTRPSSNSSGLTTSAYSFGN